MLEALAKSNTNPRTDISRGNLRRDFDQIKLSFIVGILALSLPLLLVLYAGLTWQFHDTISHFYYSDAIAEEVFSGTLIGVGLIMLAYVGRHDDETHWATAGGILAFGVAFLPADGWIVQDVVNNCPYDPSYRADVPADPWDPWIGVAHLACAFLLFSILAYFCLGIFPREKNATQGREENKKRRNIRYRLCGGLIILCLLAIAVGMVLSKTGQIAWWNCYKLSFIFEAIALLAFGYSWLVKSKFNGSSMLDDDQMRAVVLSRSLRVNSNR